MQSLLTILTRLNSYPHQLYIINTWFLINSYIYYCKLFNHLTFFTYIVDSLKLTTIRVYYKQFNGFLILFTLIKVFFVIFCITMF